MTHSTTVPWAQAKSAATSAEHCKTGSQSAYVFSAISSSNLAAHVLIHSFTHAHLDPFGSPQQLCDGWLQERLVRMSSPRSATLVLGRADATLESFGLQNVTCKLPDRQLCWIAAPSDKPLNDWAAEITDGMQQQKGACGTFTDGLQALRYSPGNFMSELCHNACHVCK